MKELIPSVSIVALLAQRDCVVERVQQATALLDEAEGVCAVLQIPGVSAALSTLSYHRSHLLVSGAVDEIRRAIDAQVWNRLLNETGLRTFMDAKSRAQWDDQVKRVSTPDLTADNIAATFGALYDSRRAMFEAGVLECFRRLSWNYKTNQPVMFGKRVLVRHVIDVWGFPTRSCDELDDLDRAMHVLAGRPEPDHRCSIQSLLRQSHAAGKRALDADMMSLRWYKVGTAHVTFRRMDLVEQLNAILVRNFPRALPAARG